MQQPSKGADLILHNGRIITLDPKYPEATNLAIKDGRIVGVDDAEEEAAFDANITWRIQRHLIFQASFVHFLTGDYVHQAGGANVNYGSTTLGFIF